MLLTQTPLLTTGMSTNIIMAECMYTVEEIRGCRFKSQFLPVVIGQADEASFVLTI